MSTRFKKAFKCKNCPQTNTENGCPMWWEIVMENDKTGEQRVDKGCGYQMLPQMMANISSKSLHAAAASYDMRNKVIKNAGMIIRAINSKMMLDFSDEELKEMENPNSKVKMIGNRREKDNENS